MHTVTINILCNMLLTNNYIVIFNDLFENGNLTDKSLFIMVFSKYVIPLEKHKTIIVFSPSRDSHITH